MACEAGFCQGTEYKHTGRVQVYFLRLCEQISWGNLFSIQKTSLFSIYFNSRNKALLLESALDVALGFPGEGS